MKETCEAMADYSSNYSDHIYETIVNNGTENRDDWDTVVRNTAYNCAWYMGTYSRGSVYQLYLRT